MRDRAERERHRLARCDGERRRCEDDRVRGRDCMAGWGWGRWGHWRRRTVTAPTSEERSRQRNETESSLELEHVVVLVSEAAKLRETGHRVLIRSVMRFCTFLTTCRHSPAFSKRANADRSPPGPPGPRSTRVHRRTWEGHTPRQPLGHRHQPGARLARHARRGWAQRSGGCARAGLLGGLLLAGSGYSSLLPINEPIAPR